MFKFATKWKEAIVVPVYKKDDKKFLKNSRPVSILPVSGNLFEKLMFNGMFKFFMVKDLQVSLDISLDACVSTFTYNP